MRRSRLLLAVTAAASLAACHSQGNSDTNEGRARSPSAIEFPAADRPVATIISTRWSDEEARDRVNEASQIMDAAKVNPGMTVADIGAGEGYYTVRLAKRVGQNGRVLAEDIVPEIIDALGRRINRENMQNVSVKLGTPDDPKLPPSSFDRIFLVHMYHEIAEPYAFLWRLYPALKPDGEIIVVDANRLTQNHGTPPPQLKCEFEAVGFKEVGFRDSPFAGGYLARFGIGGARPKPDQINPCHVHVTDSQ
ncbi:MAG TPA: class I SAM-dependent methyltransferase [Sphingobium sp.]|uniref:class I SAM-dependent methyltransferase n=1 Tax=Sphingobium sp. TaxID=1912891 RepID=UPI002ED4C383